MSLQSDGTSARLRSHCEALQQPAERVRPDARSSAVAREADDPAVSTGVGGRKQRRSAFGPGLVVHGQLESELGPVAHQVAFVLVELFD